MLLGRIKIRSYHTLEKVPYKNYCFPRRKTTRIGPFRKKTTRIGPSPGTRTQHTLARTARSINPLLALSPLTRDAAAAPAARRSGHRRPSLPPPLACSASPHSPPPFPRIYGAPWRLHAAPQQTLTLLASGCRRTVNNHCSGCYPSTTTASSSPISSPISNIGGVLLLLPLGFGHGLLHHGVVVGCGYFPIFLYCVYVNYCSATLQRVWSWPPAPWRGGRMRLLPNLPLLRLRQLQLGYASKGLGFVLLQPNSGGFIPGVCSFAGVGFIPVASGCFISRFLAAFPSVCSCPASEWIDFF